MCQSNDNAMSKRRPKSNIAKGIYISAATKVVAAIVFFIFFVILNEIWYLIAAFLILAAAGGLLVFLKVWQRKFPGMF